MVSGIHIMKLVQKRKVMFLMIISSKENAISPWQGVVFSCMLMCVWNCCIPVSRCNPENFGLVVSMSARSGSLDLSGLLSVLVGAVLTLSGSFLKSEAQRILTVLNTD